MYNPITRKIEEELVPALRTPGLIVAIFCLLMIYTAGKYGIRLVIFNLLAGGFLTGKISASSPSGRFSGDSGQAKAYRARYLNDAYHQALDTIKEAAVRVNYSLTFDSHSDC